ncbi:MAG: acyltransferase [Acidimicrobiia bacterium]|nr:acyltransferase [Acidimicrobiia bacterium]
MPSEVPHRRRTCSPASYRRLVRPSGAGNLPATMSGRLRYLPALDGLRALAVGGVILYHGGIAWAPGGFLGVDLFFVLSGYLITTLLLGEWRTDGSINLPAFWARRARRLLPALLLVLAAVALYAALIARPDELSKIRGDSFATLGYVANWHFIFGGDSYFAQFAAPSPLKHMWSLAIEEQFYLLWPLLVLGLLRLRQGANRVFPMVTGGLLVMSVTAMFVLHQPGHDPSRVYYGTDTRAQSLLVGALLAMLLRRVPSPTRLSMQRALRGAGVAAAIALACIWATVSDHSDALYRGGFLVEALLVSVVITSITQERSGPLGALLSIAPLRWMGQVSYGLYLWHWPIFVVLSPERVGIDGYALFGLRLATTFAVATLSYYFVEMPIRRGTFNARVLWRVTPAAVVAALLAVIVATAGASTPLVEVSARDLKAPEVLGARSNRVDDAIPPKRVLLVGDSLADSLAPGFQRLADEQGFELWNASVPGCGLADIGEYWLGVWRSESDACKPAWRDRWPQHIADFDPDVVVVLVGGHDTTDRLINGAVKKFDEPAGAALATHDIQLATDILSARGARVAWLTLPYSKQGWAHQVDHNRSAFNDAWVNRWNQILHDATAQAPDRASVLDLCSFVDPDGTWTRNVNGVRVRMPDLIHFNDAGADLVAQWAMPEILAFARNPAAAAAPVKSPAN